MGSKPLTEALLAVDIIHVVAPILAPVYFILASVSLAVWPLETLKETKKPSTARLKLVNNLSILAIISTYVVEAIFFLTETPIEDGRSGPENSAVYCLYSALAWFTPLLWYPGPPRSVRYPTYGFWLIYTAAEVALFSIFRALRGPLPNLILICDTLRISLLIILLCATLGGRINLSRNVNLDEESSPLLSSEVPQPAATGASYGSCDTQSNGTPTAHSKTDDPDAKKSSLGKKEDEDSGKVWGFWDFVDNFKTLIPFFWPSGNLRLQLVYVAIVLCLLAQRAINVLLPLQVGLITNKLTSGDGTLPWMHVLFYGILRLLNSGGGLNVLERLLWLPLENYSYQKLSTTGFNQIMSLSCDFHDSKNSGELWQTVYYAQSVKDVVNNVFFQVLPMIVDLALAISVLYYVFDAYMALVVATVAVFFVWSSGKIVVKQREQRRDYLKKRVDEYKILTESTSNWRTVSYFNRVPHEQHRYDSAVGTHMMSRNWYHFWYLIEGAAQSFSLTSGLMIACFMAVYQVASGNKPVGSFVMLIGYWGQLSGPLQFIANGLGDIATDLVDVERFLDLIRKKPTVMEQPGAKSMVLTKGDVEFQHVNHSYDGKREVLRDISFRARPGETTALVGQTGGGKSTILKLLFRFYDATTGTIKIDGQDVSEVTLGSLREQIGVVPQDPALFNDTIMNNIRYARFDATDEEVIEACKAVALHDRFLNFTDGYETVVGEDGVKLSGGELQRVAIAQAIIKNPRIVLLDEATSSVDSETECQVQQSLTKLSEGRTTLVIAHRLSTIMKADNIVVINSGAIVEQGTHTELLKSKGYYYQLCSMQGVTDAIHSDEQGTADTGRDGDREETLEATQTLHQPDKNSQIQGQNSCSFHSGGGAGMEHSMNLTSPLAGDEIQATGSLDEETVRVPRHSNARRRALTRSEPTGHSLGREQYATPRSSKLGLPKFPNSEDGTQPSSSVKEEEKALTKNQKRRRRKKHFRNQSKQTSSSSSNNNTSGSSEGHRTHKGEN